ncbi:HAD family hydrolase, partial [Lactobacillus sp. XV13L]|nr:HAD family hydrolase [Lactobacillus sp. XV13L]
QLGKTLTIMILLICAVVFVVGFFTKAGTEPTDKLAIDMFLVAVSLAVAAIPEGLPAIVTIILALGTQVMAAHKSIVRKLPAVETLGATDIICSDKTGTLTQNKMTVEQLYYDGQSHPASQEVSPDNHALWAMVLANDSKLDNNDQLLGDPTETALIQYALDRKIAVRQLINEHKRLQEVPFDSGRKLMSTVNQAGGEYFVAVKGAPDQLLKRVSRIELNGHVEAISGEQKEKIMAANKKMAQKALRVLALAYKTTPQLYDEPTTDSVEHDLIFAGLVGMIDPERPEAKEAIVEAHEAGIRTVMITGDFQVTAQAIAERLGILKPGQDERVVTGAQLDEFSDKYLQDHIRDFSVYARVSP